MGAWIEILDPEYHRNFVQKSLPSWERGLKSSTVIPTLFWNASLPSWERGLKSERMTVTIQMQMVAPLVGAWIEILFLRK